MLFERNSKNQAILQKTREAALNHPGFLISCDSKKYFLSTSMGLFKDQQ